MSSELDSILDKVIKEEGIRQTKTHVTENKVALTLSYIGWIVLTVGILAGLIIGGSLKDPNSELSFSPDPHPLRWVYGGSLIVSSFFSGIIFVGFGEVIKLLQAIKENTNKN